MKTLTATVTALALLFIHSISGLPQDPATLIKRTTPGNLEITALAGVDGEAVIQCWALADPSVISTVPGNEGAIASPLGPAEAAFHVRTPPRVDAGWHTAPTVQYVVIISGVMRVTVPNSEHESWVKGSSVLIAADTSSVVTGIGHRTIYPSYGETVGVGIRTAGGKEPAHTVLHDGPCPQNDKTNLDLRDVDTREFDETTDGPKERQRHH